LIDEGRELKTTHTMQPKEISSVEREQEEVKTKRRNHLQPFGYSIK